MSRVIGGWILFLATGSIFMCVERRLIAYTLFLPAAGAWMSLLFAASLFHLDNFNFSEASGWLWFVLVGLAALAIFGLYVYLRRYGRSPAAG
jgi:hypothetical protein